MNEKLQKHMLKQKLSGKKSAYTFSSSNALIDVDVSCVRNGVLKIPDGVESVAKLWKLRDCVTEIICPNSLVTIVQSAFSEFHKLTKVTFGNNVRYINDYAFCGCFDLKEVIIPDSCIYVGSRCFLDCSNLERVKLPSHLKSIERACFKGCNYLYDVEFPDNLESICFNSFENTRIERLTPNLIARINYAINNGIKFKGSSDLMKFLCH